MVLLLLARLAAAELPPPDYGLHLATLEYRRVYALLTHSCRWSATDRAFACTDDLDRAIERARAFQDTVLPDAGLEYLIGLAWRYKGDDRRATRAYREAIALDPTLDTAWYDLGEVLLVQGELDAAEEAFLHVAELVTDGTNAWVGPWRLAEVAAHRRDATSFERHLREALRRGFTFRNIEGLPNWKRFYADPALRDAIAKLVTVYAEPSVLESLETP